jgi:hypothetical protein
MMKADLARLELAVLMIDGIYIGVPAAAKSIQSAALLVRKAGRRPWLVLRFEEGAPERAGSRADQGCDLASITTPSPAY